MMCIRCHKEEARGNAHGFCVKCYASFIPMLNELKQAYIHHYMHPKKKTIYVHDESDRYK